MLTLKVTFEGKTASRRVTATFREIVNSFLVKMRRKERLVCTYFNDFHVRITKTKLNREKIISMEVTSSEPITSLSEICTMFYFVEFKWINYSEVLMHINFRRGENNKKVYLRDYLRRRIKIGFTQIRLKKMAQERI